MLLVVQFPFADLRGFLPDTGSRLRRPAWPIPELAKDFIRSSGPIRRRRQGGAREWAGEEVFGDVRRVLSFPNHIRRRTCADSRSSSRTTCLFKRYYSDGVVARFELGLRIATNSYLPPVHTTALFRVVLNEAVAVGTHADKRHETRLLDAGPLLARHFLASTTAHRATPAAELQRWWFSCGTPAVFLQHESHEHLEFPPHSRLVIDSAESVLKLQHRWLEFDNRRCSIWFLSTDTDRGDTARRLRVHMSRLHAELECLRTVLMHLDEGTRFDLSRNGAASEALQSYLNRSIQLLQRPTRAGWNQRAMLEAARRAMTARLEGEMTSLRSFRRQIARKVRRYVKEANATTGATGSTLEKSMTGIFHAEHVTVGGDFNVTAAKSINSSFNRSADTSSVEGLGPRLEALTVLIEKLSARLPAQQAEQVTRDLDVLKSEATSAHPRRPWYELSIKGITEAAKAVADLTSPIAQAMADVLSTIEGVSR